MKEYVDALERYLSDKDHTDPLVGRILTYEDAEEWDEYKRLRDSGKFPKLPCSIGDYVYTNFSMCGWHMRKKDRPYKAKIVFIGINGVDNFINVDFGNGKMYQFKFSQIGKLLFFAKEEAEQALARMEEGEIDG